jgi:hypothetical protein
MSAAKIRAPAGKVAKEPQEQSAAAPSPFPPIADYAFLSNCHTGALVTVRLSLLAGSRGNLAPILRPFTRGSIRVIF